MLERSDIARIVRQLDDAAEAAGEIDTLLRLLGADPAAVLYVAEQRAIRIDLIESGRPPVRANEPVEVRIASSKGFHYATLAWIDGFAAGLKASQQ